MALPLVLPAIVTALRYGFLKIIPAIGRSTAGKWLLKFIGNRLKGILSTWGIPALMTFAMYKWGPMIVLDSGLNFLQWMTDGISGFLPDPYGQTFKTFGTVFASTPIKKSIAVMLYLVSFIVDPNVLIWVLGVRLTMWPTSIMIRWSVYFASWASKSPV